MKKTKKLSLLLVLILVLSMLISSFTVFAAAESTEKTITIFHTNDSHGRAVENEKDGIIGFAKLKTLMDENKGAILVDAGDTTHGTTFATISRGESIVKLMNSVGYTLMAPGNHDFNYGYNRLLELSKIATFPFLSANVVKKDGTADFKASLIKEVDGIKIGFLGLSTPETKTKSNPLNTTDVEFKDYIESAKKEVALLKEGGAQAVVIVTHMGLDKASAERSDILAEKVEGVDLIIDGHSHTLLKDGQVVNGVLIAQTGDYFKNIGEVKLTFKDGKIINKKASLHSYESLKNVKPNAEILAEIAKVEESNKPYLEKVIGKAAVELVGERAKVRTGETNFGNLLTDAMIDATGADVAITNGGGIRASIPAGDITMGHVLTSFPFTNYPVKLEVTGETIVKALEHGLDSAPEEVGKFPHVAGMTFKYDQTAPVGKRVFALKIKGADIDPKKTYTLVTNDFMSVGGDGYEMFKGAKVLSEYPLLSEVLATYITAKKEVSPKVEGRVVPEKNTTTPTTDTTFTDIKGHWAEKYILEVTKSGYFTGVGNSRFAPQSKITRAMLVTVLGRYDLEKNKDAKVEVSKFTDIKDANAWYAKYVNWAATNEIVKGFEDGSFKPDQEVSREQMAAIISRYLFEYKKMPLPKIAPKPFDDEAQISTWAVKDVYNTVIAEVITGKPNNVFDPKGTATRAELAKIMFEVNKK